MTDKLTPKQRHKCMSHIRAKNTKPEVLVRKWLWKDGFRYRLYVKGLPGSPDIVIRKYKIAIFINGCFWHGHDVSSPSGEPEDIISSTCCKIPKTRTDFWTAKIARNRQRDAMNYYRLKQMGWTVLVVWECWLKGKEQREQTLKALSYRINSLIIDSYKGPHQIEEDNIQEAAEESEQYL